MSDRKIRTRRRLQECALRLFGEQGFEETTVAQIAAEAGTSEMTFFRYFTSKAAVVESDDLDPLIADAIRARPARERPITAVGHALAGALAELDSTERAALRNRLRLIQGTPALRAHWWDRQRVNKVRFAEAIAARTTAGTDGLEVAVLAAVCVAAAGTALLAWASDDETADLVGLLNTAFEVLR